jgi:hypothetical protein
MVSGDTPTTNNNQTFYSQHRDVRTVNFMTMCSLLSDTTFAETSFHVWGGTGTHISGTRSAPAPSLVAVVANCSIRLINEGIVI